MSSLANATSRRNRGIRGVHKEPGREPKHPFIGSEGIVRTEDLAPVWSVVVSIVIISQMDQ